MRRGGRGSQAPRSRDGACTAVTVLRCCPMEVLVVPGGLSPTTHQGCIVGRVYIVSSMPMYRTKAAGVRCEH